MTTTLPALEAMRAIFLAATPGPEPIAERIHIYPNEEKDIKLTLFPFVVVNEVVNITNSFNSSTLSSHSKTWRIEVKVFIQGGQIEINRVARSVDQKTAPWPDAVEEVLLNQHDLYRTVFKIGTGQVFFQWVTGPISYGVNSPKKFWGIHFMFPITQLRR